MKVASSRPGFLGQALIIFLLFFDATILFLAVFFTLKPFTIHIIAWIDLVISIILLALLLWALLRIEDRNNFIKQNWILILSVIPIYFLAMITGLLGDEFILKILGLLKILSLYFFAQKYTTDVIKYQEKTRLVYAIAIFLVVLFLCSFVFFAAEHGVNPEVGTYEDSIWFVLQTITTVGYGDIIPITDLGRIMGMISMLSALILTSIVTSVATFSLIEKFRKGTDLATHRIREEVEDLDNKLDNINHRLDEMDNSKNMAEIKDDLQDLKADIDDIKEYIRKKH